MKKVIAGICLAAMVFAMSATAASKETAHFTLNASKQDDQVVLTVAAKDVSFNALQFAIKYDPTKLKPAFAGQVYDELEYAEDMTSFLAPLSKDGGWMEYITGQFNLEKGIVEYVLSVDQNTREKPGGADKDGYITAGSSGQDLLSLHFTIVDNATITADSLKLTGTESNPDALIISTKSANGPVIELGSEYSYRDLTALGVPLTDTTEPEPSKPQEDNNSNGGSDNSNGGTDNSNGGTDNSNGGSDNQDSNSLKDIKGFWFETYVKDLIARGIITGYSDGTFRPQANLTRGEFCVVLTKTLGLKTTQGASEFKDVSGWVAPYVNAVREAGLVNGVGNGLFAPEAPITRQEMIKLIADAFKLEEAQDQTYPDKANTAKWAEDGINRALASGLVKGDAQGKVNPTTKVTRAEMSAIISRALQLVQK